MNDMSAQFAVAATCGANGAHKIPGHVFRGVMMDKCAVIEKWAAGIIEVVKSSPAGDRLKKKRSYLFGQRLATLREIAELEPPVFRSPKRVIGLLDRLQPYALLRAALGHAVQEIVMRPDGNALFIFDLVGRSEGLSGRDRLTFTEPEMREITRQVADLANRLSQEKLRDGL